ncbi:M24 family metallopeptidase [Kineosporia mesophila]|uniref:M24 family metallopeptidase n=1 Tax=Kineosporia mesophila TaxID=566012 RepID=A0ABP7AMC1_9ACTN|nr:M24 family metallopeptidase [Kineosporia mesophila]MCD5353969.1 aminopeptidase P family protein [Kineosporia mesophila]
MNQTEHQAHRGEALREAETKASHLFTEVIERGLIVPGKNERQLSDEIRDLAGDLFGIRKFWHKRIVRAGVNTLEPYRSNPPNRQLSDDEILFFDFGPVFEEWEADFGRTYVLGDDPDKHHLTAELPRLWHEARRHFEATPDITGEQFFAHILGLIEAGGWGHGAAHAGHLVGEFPHERINGDDIDCYITTGNDQPMRRPDAAGQDCHWILEIHLVNRERGFGGFFEQLLDL